MILHPLPPDARCPYCRKGGLAFVRQRAYRGDVYRCTAVMACEGRAIHHQRNRGVCGVSAEAATGQLLFWTECPGQEPAAKEEMTVEFLTTRQVAERLQVPVYRVAHLLARGELSGTKISWTRPPVLIACARKPSSFSSYAQDVPSGSLSACCKSIGSMKRALIFRSGIQNQFAATTGPQERHGAVR